MIQIFKNLPEWSKVAMALVFALLWFFLMLDIADNRGRSITGKLFDRRKK
jgi:hypothetical protein